MNSLTSRSLPRAESLNRPLIQQNATPPGPRQARADGFDRAASRTPSQSSQTSRGSRASALPAGVQPTAEAPVAAAIKGPSVLSHIAMAAATLGIGGLAGYGAFALGSMAVGAIGGLGMGAAVGIGIAVGVGVAIVGFGVLRWAIAKHRQHKALRQAVEQRAAGAAPQDTPPQTPRSPTGGAAERAGEDTPPAQNAAAPVPAVAQTLAPPPPIVTRREGQTTVPPAEDAQEPPAGAQQAAGPSSNPFVDPPAQQVEQPAQPAQQVEQPAGNPFTQAMRSTYQAFRSFTTPAPAETVTEPAPSPRTAQLNEILATPQDRDPLSRLAAGERL